jgi:uncharacterized integral membrane protein
VIKLLCAVVIAVIATIFAMDNMHHIELGLFVGQPVHVRLFFLLLISFLAGCFAPILINLYMRAIFKKKTEITQDTEEDDFFSD